MGQEAPLPPLSQSSSTPVKDNKVKQEPELIVIDEEEDEIELWNDEEGIVQQLLMDVDFDTAPKKRQRTQSPPVMEKKSDIQKTSYTVVHVEAPKDLLGSEVQKRGKKRSLAMLFIFGHGCGWSAQVNLFFLLVCHDDNRKTSPTWSLLSVDY